MNQGQRRYQLCLGNFIKWEQGKMIFDYTVNSYSRFLYVNLSQEHLGIRMLLEIPETFYLTRLIQGYTIKKYIPQSLILRGITRIYYTIGDIYKQPIEGKKFHIQQYRCLTITEDTLKKLGEDISRRPSFIHTDFAWYDFHQWI